MDSEPRPPAGPSDDTPDEPDTDLLYPELAAHGRLATALMVVAATVGLDLGVVEPSESDTRGWALVASTVADRRPMGVGTGSVERWFLVTAWSRGVSMVSGKTRDLTEVVRAAAAWREGASLSQIKQAAPFVEIGDLALAHEIGPAAAVDVQWHHLRQREHGAPLRVLLETAGAEPRLRRLYPYTSHETLLFSTCTGYPYSRDVALVAPLADNRYRVFAADRTTQLGDVDTPAEAIRLVVAALPDDVGPAVAGTWEELTGHEI